MINIYKASAGAGKTYKLAGEYINLLFKEENGHKYKHILAVTFTNKATKEMKDRILDELFKLSSGKKSGYLNQLIDNTGHSEERIRSDAKIILYNILHDYSLFSVSTIDKFFQSIMRSFARELGKMFTYNVEIDELMVRQNAVDKMYSSLDDPNNKELLKWLIEFSMDVIEEGGSWNNIKNNILSLSGNLLKEDFRIKNREKKIGDIKQLKKNISNIKSKFESELCNLAQDALDVISSKGISISDYAGGSRSPFNNLLKYAKGNIETIPDTFRALYDDPDKWVTKKNRDKLTSYYDDRINEDIGRIIDLYDNRFEIYNTALIIRKNIHYLGIMDNIYSHIINYCKEKNIVLISETTELLNRIIDGNDTPFIYEKIGTRLDHFMLDEFQDTSKMQWENFKPLLQESISQNYDNLVVGDVKQSIYRWRNSDWSILNSGLAQSFRKNEIEQFNLNFNWRSAKHVVQFNNDFFSYASSIAQNEFNNSLGGVENNQINEIYSNFEQELSPNSKLLPGYVELQFIDKEIEESVVEKQIELMLERVSDVISRGYRAKDIAILVRKNKEGSFAAKALSDKGYMVISNDSIYIKDSSAVLKIINILRTLDNPDKDIIKTYEFLYGYKINKDDLLADEDINVLPLYNKCEHIIRKYLTEQEKQDMSYIQAFLDCVLDYVNNNGADISAFLKWWDENGVRKTISAPDTDAINILTIHKSKGLGYKVIIVPFFECELDTKSSGFISTTLWCTIDNPEFNFNAPIPVTYEKRLSNSLFRNEYYYEKLYSYIDALNLSYVAFTRAKEELYVFSQKPKPNKSTGNITINCMSDILYLYSLKKSSFFDFNNNEYVFGEKFDNKLGSNSGSNSGNSVEINRIIEIDPIQVFSDDVDVNRIRTSIQTDPIGEDNSIRNKGIALHSLFSYIKTKKDIKEGVKKAIYEGIIDSPIFESDRKEKITNEELEQILSKELESIIDSVSEYGWFNEDCKIINELDIITETGRLNRPDRVVFNNNGDSTNVSIIDYKFGTYDDKSDILKKYQRQIKNYVYLLNKMGYNHVRGYVWYILDNKIINGI